MFFSHFDSKYLYSDESFFAGLLLEVTEISTYKPRTVPTQVVFSKMLAVISSLLGDQMPEVLSGAADEVRSSGSFFRSLFVRSFLFCYCFGCLFGCLLFLFACMCVYVCGGSFMCICGVYSH